MLFLSFSFLFSFLRAAELERTSFRACDNSLAKACCLEHRSKTPLEYNAPGIAHRTGLRRTPHLPHRGQRWWCRHQSTGRQQQRHHYLQRSRQAALWRKTEADKCHIVLLLFWHCRLRAGLHSGLSEASGRTCLHSKLTGARAIVRRISECLLPQGYAHFWREGAGMMNYPNFWINGGWINNILLYCWCGICPASHPSSWTQTAKELKMGRPSGAWHRAQKWKTRCHNAFATPEQNIQKWLLRGTPNKISICSQQNTSNALWAFAPNKACLQRVH